jgi:hypothetical protein
MKYKGSCHCGKVAIEVEGELNGAMACNCSMCSRKGSLLWFVPRDKLRVLTAEEEIATYTFNKHVIKHRFCPTCGIHPYGEGIDPKGNRMAAPSTFAASKESIWRACRFSTSTGARCETSNTIKEVRLCSKIQKHLVGFR